MTDVRDVALPQPGRVGQATAIEQSRAVAEVYAAVMVAREVPRNERAAERRMQESCRRPALAERAFFAFPRGGSTIEGASIHLARELARVWGNIQHGVSELRRDDEHGQSEMLAFAWDLETNARVQTIFIVPHMRDKRGGPERLVDLRDLYENNANQGARRVRECIFAVLPPQFVEDAKTLCQQTLEHGGGKPLEQRIADMIAGFKPLSVSAGDIARRLGRQREDWTAENLAELATVFGSLKRREITREEAFPSVVSVDEIPKAPPPADALPAPDRAGANPDWHNVGHPGDGPRHVWDPNCALCPEDDPARVHYYGHNVDFVDDCEACQREKTWKAEDDGGGQT